MSKGSQAVEWFGVGLLVAYTVALFAHRDPPSMTDYANWTYQGALLARHVMGFSDAAHVLKHYPVPNSAVTLGIGLLALVTPWMIAAKVWLCLQMLLMFLALRHLVRTINATAAVWFIVPQAVFFGVNWWYGFVNFELGCAWVLLMASLLLRRVQLDQSRDGTIGVLLVFAFFTHMIPFAFCGLLVMLYARQTGRWRILWQLVPAALLTAWYLIGRFWLEANADGQAGMVSPVRNYSAGFWAYKANSYVKSFGFVDPNGAMALRFFGRPMFLVLFLANAAICVLLGCWMFRAAQRAFRERTAERFLWLGIAVLIPLYLLAPGTALGVSDPGSRLLQVGLALGLVLCCAQPSRALRLAGIFGGALTVAVFILFVQFAFGSALYLGTPLRVPEALAEFTHVPNHDQDYFYRALEQGDYKEPVFPTGMFLNASPR